MQEENVGQLCGGELSPIVSNPLAYRRRTNGFSRLRAPIYQWQSLYAQLAQRRRRCVCTLDLCLTLLHNSEDAMRTLRV